MNTEPEITPEPKVEAYTFSKDKLPRELSYPLKRSQLDDALRAASVYATVWFVRYLGRPNGNTVLDAHFEPEQTGYASSGKVMITVWAVPAEQRKESENLVLDQSLPSLCQWIAKSQFEGNVWRGSGHSLTFECTGKTLRRTER